MSILINVFSALAGIIVGALGYSQKDKAAQVASDFMTRAQRRDAEADDESKPKKDKKEDGK